MKYLSKLFIPLMIIAAYFVFNEQNKSGQNIYILIIAIVVFMFGMMQLSAKTPSKNSEKNNDNV